MSSQHTPGPWAFAEGDKDRREVSRIHKANDAEWLIGYAICESMNRHQRAEDIANARLIAAAPDLLRALQWFADFAGEPCVPGENGANLCQHSDCEAVRMALAAIARATQAS